MKRIVQKIACVTALCAAQSLFADTLASIYDLAVNNDPQLRAARAAYLAGQESGTIGRAGLLPQITASAGYSETDSDDETSRFLGGSTSIYSSGDTDTDETTYSLTLTQPIFDLPAWYDYKQGKTVSEQARIQYLADQQELVLRVSDAYFNVLRASENLNSANAEQEAIGRQLEQTRQRYEVGLLPITDVHEAQAAYDDAAVNTLVLKGELNVAFEALEVLTGQPHTQLAGLVAAFPVNAPDAAREDWVALSLTNNLQLKTSQMARDAAKQNADARKFEHLPTITGSFAYQDLDQDSTFNGVSGFGGPPAPVNNPSSQESEIQTVAVTLNVPIFTGGLTSAKRRQAYQQFVQADETAIQLLRNTTQQARSAHLNVVTNAARVKARQQAITSAESALEATRAGYDVGTRNIVDVLFAERTLHQAKRNYANARYDYINSTLALKRVAGQLSPEDIYQLNAWLDPALLIQPVQ